MNLARASSLIGSVTMLSYAFLLLMLDQSHLTLLCSSTFLILLSFWLGRFPHYQRFFSIQAMAELKLPAEASVPPVLNESEAIFLLKNGGFVIYDLPSLETQLGAELGIEWECAPPLVFEDLIGAWAKGQFIIFSRTGKILSRISIPLQGVSLSFVCDKKLYLGTTQEFIHCFCSQEKQWKSFPSAGVPLSWDPVANHLFTSSGSFYSLTGHEPEIVCSTSRTPLGSITLSNTHFYFDTNQKIVRLDPNGERHLGFYHRDFFYPFRAGEYILFVDREHHLCLMNHTGEVTRPFRFLSSPIWVRHTPHFLVVALQRNAEIEVYGWPLDTNDFSTPICFQGAGSFMPLGMGDCDLFFSVKAELWYHWKLKANDLVTMPGPAASQVLVSGGKVLMNCGGKWMHAEQEVSNCQLEVQEANYEYQANGFFPIG